MIIDGKNVPLEGENYWVPGGQKKGVVTFIDYVAQVVHLKELNLLGEVSSSSPDLAVPFSNLGEVIPKRKLEGFN